MMPSIKKSTVPPNGAILVSVWSWSTRSPRAKKSSVTLYTRPACTRVRMCVGGVEGERDWVGGGVCALFHPIKSNRFKPDGRPGCRSPFDTPNNNNTRAGQDRGYYAPGWLTPSTEKCARNAGLGTSCADFCGGVCFVCCCCWVWMAEGYAWGEAP